MNERSLSNVTFVVQLHSHKGRSESVHKGIHPNLIIIVQVTLFRLLQSVHERKKERNYSNVMIVIKSFLLKEISIDLFYQFMKERSRTKINSRIYDDLS